MMLLNCAITWQSWGGRRARHNTDCLGATRAHWVAKLSTCQLSDALPPYIMKLKVFSVSPHQP